MVLINLASGKEWSCRCRDRLVDTVGEGEGGANWESIADMNIPPRVKELASGKLLNSTGSSARCSVIN